jgi:putative ABC transport system ATP-binding protein
MTPVIGAQLIMSLVQTENLTKIYGRDETAIIALDHVDMSVGTGELVAVMGPSGGGKSTLLHLIGGLDRPSEGRVLIDGTALNDLSDQDMTRLRRRKIGFVFQFYNLIPVLSALDNAALPLTLDGIGEKKSRAKAAEWLEKVGLGDRLNSRPDELSGGQQQRVAIARALVAEPKLILADEPTGNLDTHSAGEIAELLRQVTKQWGRSVVMVTHDPRIASYADRILFLRDGAIVDEVRVEKQGTLSPEWVAGKMQQIVEVRTIIPEGGL